jgi:phosphotransferase system enzyme I (PtsI)
MDSARNDVNPKKKAKERILEGLGVSPGVAIGPAHLRDSGELSVPEYIVPANRIEDELERFRNAVSKAIRQVGKLKVKATSHHGAAAEELGYLLDAHLQMLKSTRLIGGIEKRIRDDHRNAEAAVMAEIASIAQDFAEMDDPYLRTRAQEVKDVGQRIVRGLTKSNLANFDALDTASVIVAEEITPADTALMNPSVVAGFASVLGGAEGHTAIMARSLGLPAVLGVPDLTRDINNGDQVIVDGSNGLVIVNPTAKRLSDYEARLKELAREVKALARLRDVRAITRDKENVTLQANLEFPREVGGALAAGAEGVGLLRTEFLFMNREDLPDEDTQYEALAEVVTGMAGRTVTIRTLDVGGEKLAFSLGDQLTESPNPALGLRAIRLSLRERALLDTQLGAILRAAVHGPLRVLLPLISSPQEVREVRKAMETVRRRLKRRGQKVADTLPPLGVMIEVPGAALAADALAMTADFFALGTNDLTMYTLAIDRGEEQVAHLYNPLHPAVLRLIQFSVDAALRARIPVSVCGEMAGDPRYTALLLGLGVRELSMVASALPRVKNRIIKLDMQAATRRAQIVMDQVDSGRIAMLIDDFNEALH